MAAPLAKTFQTLTTTVNPFAGELLIAALDVPFARIQAEAVKSLVGRGGVREQMEAVRRYPDFSAEIRGELEKAAASMVPAIRQCLLVGRGRLESAALELARNGEAFGIIETVLGILRSGQTELHEEAAETLRQLVNRLYEHLRGMRPPEARPLKNPGQVQHLALEALDRASQLFQELAHADEVVESILVLGGAGHPLTQKLLNQAGPECRKLAKDLLLTSRHPGVMGFLLDSLGKPYPPARVVDALQSRSDPEFLLATLRWVPKRWTSTQERNLKQIEHIGWLDQSGFALELIPEELQSALMTYVSATGLNRDQKTAVREWVVRYGCPQARDSAIAVLDELADAVVQEIVLDGLDSENPDVQAWATSQLRSQHVPDAISKLIDRLDSPEASVQAVARQELQGFDLECLLSRFEGMSPPARKNAAELLKKIQPGFLSELVQELNHPIRRRRLRAIRGSLAYGWHLQVFPSLLELLQDEDSLIRRSAVEVLGYAPTPEAVAALVALKSDESERVRETVENSLALLAAQEILNPPPGVRST